MRTHEFFKLYADLPLEKRKETIENGMTLDHVYAMINHIEDRIRPAMIEKGQLLNMACDYFIKNNLI